MTSQTIPTALAALQIQRITTTKKEQSKVTNLKRSDHVFVKSISGATSRTLRNYVIPTVEIEPEVIVIHCDTNM